MFENVTYESILDRMLRRVPKDLDKREGSVIYTALAPAAAELQIMYIELDAVLKETFADTASREYLIKRAAERGVYPYPATPAVLKAVAVPDTVEIESGERFNLGTLNYVVVKRLEAGVYQVECETSGTIGGSRMGTMIPIGTVPGLESITLTELLIPGRDDETKEDILERYMESFDVKSFGGNRKDYLNKVHAIAGVGGVKVTRAWNGPSTVKLTILDAAYNKASDVLVQTVQEQIDPTMDGDGVGLAPIDHIVTVDTVQEVEIAVCMKLTFGNGYDFEDVKGQIEEAVKAYLSELRSEWESQGFLTVRIRQVEARLMDIRGIEDISNTTINGMGQNLILGEAQIPIFGGVQAG